MEKVISCIRQAGVLMTDEEIYYAIVGRPCKLCGETVYLPPHDGMDVCGVAGRKCILTNCDHILKHGEDLDAHHKSHDWLMGRTNGKG